MVLSRAAKCNLTFFLAFIEFSGGLGNLAGILSLQFPSLSLNFFVPHYQISLCT